MHNKTRHQYLDHVFTIALIYDDYHLFIYEPGNSRDAIRNVPVVKKALGEHGALAAARSFIDGAISQRRPA
jgi:hypothetical protein